MRGVLRGLRRDSSALPRSVWLVGAALAGLTVYLRSGISDHFTHVDDVGVAFALVSSPEHVNPASIRARLDSAREQPTRVRRALKAIEHTPLFAPAASLASFVAAATEVPSSWTYAPLQFFATAATVRLGSDYESRLFWARAPSALASIGAVIAVGFLSVGLFAGVPGRSGLVVLTASLVGLSLQQVVYGKQAESYAIGVLAIVLMMLLLERQARSVMPAVGPRVAIRVAILVALLCHTQYQVLFALPAFFYAWWADRRRLMNSMQAVRPVALSSMVLGGLLIPMYVLFLRRAASLGVNGWNRGPDGEFAFHPPQGVGGSFLYFLQFFPQNGYLAFEAQVATVPDWHPTYRPIGIVLAALAIVGLVALVRSPHRSQRAIGRFTAVLGVTWIALVMAQRMTLSPTRHSMILLPVFAVCIAAGVVAVAGRLPASAAHRAPLALSAALAVCAVTSLPRARAERRRPLDEPALERVLREHGVSVLYSYGCTVDAFLMPSVRFARHIYNEGCVGPSGWYAPLPADVDRIAFLSLREPFTDSVYERARQLIGSDGQSMAAHLSLPPKADMQESYREFRTTDVEVDVSRRTRNGTNDLYLVILERRRGSTLADTPAYRRRPPSNERIARNMFNRSR